MGEVGALSRLASGFSRKDGIWGSGIRLTGGFESSRAATVDGASASSAPVPPAASAPPRTRPARRANRGSSR